MATIDIADLVPRLTRTQFYLTGNLRKKAVDLNVIQITETDEKLSTFIYIPILEVVGTAES